MTPHERAREIVKTLGFAFDNAGGRRFVDEVVAEEDIAAAIREAVEAERDWLLKGVREYKAARWSHPEDDFQKGWNAFADAMTEAIEARSNTEEVG